MALARAWAVALTGVTGHLIAVEADLAAGLPGTRSCRRWKTNRRSR